MRRARSRSILIALALIAFAQLSQADTPAAQPNTPLDVNALQTPPAESALEQSTNKAGTEDRPVRAPEPLPEIETLNLGASPRSHSADTDDQNTTADQPWLLQTLSALGIVIALIFVLRAVMRRLAGPNAPSSRGGLVEVLARTPIGPKTYILFLKISDRVIVAAQSPAGINNLTTLDDPEDVANLLQQVSAAQPASISDSFRKLMQREHEGYEEPDLTAEEGADQDEQYVDRTRDQLTSLMTRIRSLGSRTK